MIFASFAIVISVSLLQVGRPNSARFSNGMITDIDDFVPRLSDYIYLWIIVSISIDKNRE